MRGASDWNPQLRGLAGWALHSNRAASGASWPMKALEAGLCYHLWLCKVSGCAPWQEGATGCTAQLLLAEWGLRLCSPTRWAAGKALWSNETSGSALQAGRAVDCAPKFIGPPG